MNWNPLIICGGLIVLIFSAIGGKRSDHWTKEGTYCCPNSSCRGRTTEHYYIGRLTKIICNKCGEIRYNYYP